MKINLSLFNFQKLIGLGLKSLLEKEPNLNTMIFDIPFSELLIREDLIKKTDVLLIQFNLQLTLSKQIQKFKKINSDLKIIALGENYSEELFYALNNSINSYLDLDINIFTLLEAIDSVIINNTYIDPSNSRYYIKMLTQNDIQNKKKLTKRELEILVLICNEKTTKEIADILYISSRTVENHRKNLNSKTNSKSTAGLVKFAIKNKIFIY